MEARNKELILRQIEAVPVRIHKGVKDIEKIVKQKLHRF